ncbi:SDR family NAD(P)-dependent oxidoreductase [Salinirubrum litoreum]|uniref:SDR family NAD(P)-dependent oxidoreductase n=1 Tax=Salinirubrum litoreum TaxID=1126234 RepID=A0ABD5RGK0_9EURY|nr:SDR family NAD(P)-dependent oxidoreductase [Salinirubrum litoreum]
MPTTGTAIVTGGSRGIGRAICTELAERGADVVVADIDTDRIQGSVDAVEAAGQEALPIRTDISNFDSVRDCIDQTLARFGSVEMLVNNAGIAGPTAACEDVSPDEWDQTLNVNLRGGFYMCREVLPAMKEAGYGRIVNIASVTGKRPLVNRTPYATAKMGIIGFTRTLAAEVGRHDINVNAVCPGSVDGPRIQRVFEQQAEMDDRSPREVEQEVRDESARRELVDRETVANTVAYLCSEDSRQITGQDINVSAGKVMY